MGGFMIELPAIFLSFDDKHIIEWTKYLTFFPDNNMKVTFYVSYFVNIKLEEWNLIRLMQTEGHTIAHHGYNHDRAGEIVSDHGCQKLMNLEVAPVDDLFETQDILKAQHYSYPYGNGTEKSDRCLLRRFSTLRYGGRARYAEKALRQTRIFKAANFGKRANEKFCGHEGWVDKAIEDKMAIFLYMHQPVKHRLEWLASKNVNFYPMSVLDR